MDFAAHIGIEKEKNICSINLTALNLTECSSEQERGQLEVVAILRIFTSCLSILGALSIIGSALYRKTFCNPKVHPLFVLSIADLMLSILWICGSVVWLKGGFQNGNLRVRCFSINLMTVILQCVAMNLTLLYALLAYSSIKQKDFSGVYMVQQRSDSIHVWHPLCSFTAYLIAWMLPAFIIMIPFGVMSSYYGLVSFANTCSCWCMPYLGNVIPTPDLRIANKVKYLEHLHNFVAFYGATISANFLVVLVCMIIIYYKVFKRIRRMGKTQEQNETTPLYGATQAMILEGQKDARTRVLLFIAVFFISGIVTLTFAIREINNYYNPHHQEHPGIYRLYIMLVVEALFVPIQGFLNAAVYGWTRGDFLNVMSSRKVYSRPNHFSLSYENEEETVVEDDGEEDGERWQRDESQRMGNSILFLSIEQEGGSVPVSRRQGANNAITPGSPGVLLGEGNTE